MYARRNSALSRHLLDMDEFDFIATHLAPLAGSGGLGLTDDAALLKPSSGKDLVLTKDTMVEGVHFPQGQYGAATAGKLLRVNLSDLAAKAAKPIGYMLSVAWPRGVDKANYNGFASGLRDMQEAHDFKLLGGDTVSTDGPMVVTATLIGEVPQGGMVLRSGANIGDDVWITGTIGDAYLGLQSILGRKLDPDPSEDAISHFEDAYYRPELRLAFRKALRQYATACADISDGLIADVGHIAKASGVEMSLQKNKVPLSIHAKSWLAKQSDTDTAFKSLVTAGDDYELVFTASPESRPDIEAAAKLLGINVVKIGIAQNGEGVQMVHKDDVLEFTQTGHKHF